MKEFLKKYKVTIIAVIIAVVISSAINVCATIMYKASEIEFTSKNANFKATNVEDALNGLYGESQKEQIYSTEERVIGKWIDGKPLYRKVITRNVNLASGKNQYTENNVLSNIEYLKQEGTSYYDLTFQNRVSSQLMQIWGNDYNSSVGIYSYIKSDNTVSLEIRKGSNSAAISTATWILQYTKTTD